jgi:hypothetical protein
MIEELDKDIL